MLIKQLNRLSGIQVLLYPCCSHSVLRAAFWGQRGFSHSKENTQCLLQFPEQKRGLLLLHLPLNTEASTVDMSMSRFLPFKMATFIFWLPGVLVDGGSLQNLLQELLRSGRSCLAQGDAPVLEPKPRGISKQCLLPVEA
jgi:hypothetical protein